MYTQYLEKPFVFLNQIKYLLQYGEYPVLF